MTRTRRPRREVRARPVAPGPLLRRHAGRIDAADCWATPVLPDDSRAPGDWAEAVFGFEPPVLAALMKIRNAVVRPFGIAASPKRESGAILFPVLEEDDDEVVLGGDDKHLSFQVGIALDADNASVTTLVTIHNVLGRAYWAVVRYFHAPLVRATIRATGPVTAQGG